MAERLSQETWRTLRDNISRQRGSGYGVERQWIACAGKDSDKVQRLLEQLGDNRDVIIQLLSLLDKVKP